MKRILFALFFISCNTNQDRRRNFLSALILELNYLSIIS